MKHVLVTLGKKLPKKNSKRAKYIGQYEIQDRNGQPVVIRKLKR